MIFALVGLGVLAAVVTVAFFCDRHGQRAEPLAAAASPTDDATREIGAIRDSWDSVLDRRIVPSPPYRLATDTAPQAAVRVQTPGRHRAAV